MQPISDMRASAIALHELYSSYIAAGFNRREAFTLTQTALAETIHAEADNRNNN